MKTDNELIAEFMGVTVWKNWGEYLGATYYKMHHGKPTNDSPLTDVQVAENKMIESKNVYAPLRYDTSWDWLMPVVEKIESLRYCARIVRHGGERCVIYDPEVHNSADVYLGKGFGSSINQEKKITAVHSAVVEFIKWYNSTKEPTLTKSELQQQNDLSEQREGSDQQL